MRKIISIGIIALLIIVGVSQTASAQFAQSPLSPVLYNQNGQVVNGFNSATGALIAGTYYTQTGVERYYFPNGTYYQPSAQLYGGTIVYPNAPGPAGVVVNPGVFTPGVPNTGAGGNSMLMWSLLGLSAVVVVGGIAYTARRRESASESMLS